MSATPARRLILIPRAAAPGAPERPRRYGLARLAINPPPGPRTPPPTDHLKRVYD